MMEVKTLLLEEVRTRLYDRLKDTASAIVKEIVQREIEERVRQQVSRGKPTFRETSIHRNARTAPRTSPGVHA